MQGEVTAAAAPARVLIIDDDPALLRTLVTVLVAEGFAVETAADGADGLERARQQCPAVVLLDLHLPVMDGYAFLAAFRATPACAAVPVILMTGSEDPDTARRRIGPEGVVLLLRKPFDLDAMLVAVRGVVHAPARPSR